jgi:5'-nucleotidase
LRYDIDASAAFGSRVSNVEINARVAGNWSAIDLSATYNVVTNDFIASGRDGYDTFGTVFSAGLFVDTFTEYAQGFIDYIELLTEAGESLSKLPLEEYSTKNYIGRDGCNHTTEVCTGY